MRGFRALIARSVSLRVSRIVECPQVPGLDAPMPLIVPPLDTLSQGLRNGEEAYGARKLLIVVELGMLMDTVRSKIGGG